MTKRPDRRRKARPFLLPSGRSLLVSAALGVLGPLIAVYLVVQQRATQRMVRVVGRSWARCADEWRRWQ